MTCFNCGSDEPSYEHESCGHEVCSLCGEKHIEDCEWISKQTFSFFDEKD